MTSVPLHSRWRRFRRLSVQEQWLLLESFVLLPLNRAAVRLIGYYHWQALLYAWLPCSYKRCNSYLTEPNSGLQPHRIAHIVHAAGREGFLTGACLERALALWWLLRWRHFPAELRIGARRQDGRFEAHAWIELDGVVLNDKDAFVYAPFENCAAPTGDRP